MTGTKALFVGGTVSAVGAVLGGFVGSWLGGIVGEDFSKKSHRRFAEGAGGILGVAVGAGIAGGLASWQIEKRAALPPAGQ